MKNLKTGLMTAAACSVVLSAGAANAQESNIDLVTLSNLLQILSALSTESTTRPTEVLPLDAQNPYRHANGSRSNNLNNALNSWRQDTQFRADTSKSLLGLEHAYARGLSGQGINIGINDEGIHFNHPLFSTQGKVTGYTSQAGTNYGNGGTPNPRRPFASHGSHVAGTAAGSRVAGQAMFGTAFNSTITSATINFQQGDVRWTHDSNQGVTTDTSYDNLAGLIATPGVRIVNNSWGVPTDVNYNFNDLLSLRKLYGNYTNLAGLVSANDTLVVFAAGNDIGKHASAIASAPFFNRELESNWLSVVNVRDANNFSATSNYCGVSAAWCVAAPGENIISAIRGTAFNFNAFVQTLNANERIALTQLANANGTNYYTRLQTALTNSFQSYNSLVRANRSVTTSEHNRLLGVRLAKIHAVHAHVSPNISLTYISQFAEKYKSTIGAANIEEIITAAQEEITRLNGLYRLDLGSQTNADTGTSMAAPAISGFAALLMENFPQYNTGLITDILVSSAPINMRVNKKSGWGIPQMQTALNGPSALRAVRDVNVAVGDVDVWTNDIFDATIRYDLEVLALNTHHIGGLNKIGGGELITTGGLSYSGPTRVTEGLLTVEGRIFASATSVAHRGIIGGTGRIHNLTAEADGVVAPGSSANLYGRLTITDNATFTPGSYLWIRAREANGTVQHSQLSVGRTAELGDATLILKANEGTWTQSVDALPVVVAGNLTGRFATVNTDLAYLTPSLSYTPTAANLSLVRNERRIADAGTTPAERAVGSVLDVLTGRPEPLAATPDDVTARNTRSKKPTPTVAEAAASAASAFNSGAVTSMSLQKAILDSSLAVSQASLRLLTGEVHASLAGLTSANAGFLRSATLERGRTQPSSTTTTQAINDAGVTAWASGSFGNGKFDGNNELYRYRSDTQGFAAGLDKTFTNGSLIGVAIGQNRSELKLNDLNSQGTTRDQQIAVYGSTNFNGFGVRAGGSWISADVDTNRAVSINRLSERLLGEYEGDGWQAYAEISAAFGNETLSIEPYVNYAHYRFDADVKETGGASALGGQINNRSDLVTGGVRLNAAVTDGTTLPRIRAVAHLAYTDDLSDKGSAYNARLVDSDNFLVNGFQPNDGAVTAELGINVQATQSVSIDFGYTGLHQSDYKDNRAYARLSIKF